jgi:hypothetical protein
MEEQEQLQDENPKATYGFSRKSNVAIAAIAGLAAVQQSKIAVIAIVIIASLTIISQHVLDWFDKDDSY